MIELTAEQLAIVDYASAGHSVLVQAVAGAGKTSTLVALAQRIQSMGDSGTVPLSGSIGGTIYSGVQRDGTIYSGAKSLVYITFSKKLATEAEQRFPSNTECRTAHSLAFRGCPVKLGRKIQNSAWEIHRSYLNLLKAHYIPAEGDLDVSQMVSECLRTISRYQNSDSTDILAFVDEEHAQRADVERYVQMIWAAMTNPRSTFPCSHDTYLKLWELSRPKLPFDVVLLDEAQDSNPVILSIVMSHYSNGGQVVLVGDTYQQLYDWRGAINAMASVDLPVLPMSQSFRFGSQIADVANPIIRSLGATYPVAGHPDIDSTVYWQGEGPEPTAILARTNGALFAEVLPYLERDKRIMIIGGADALCDEIDGLCTLLDGKRTDVARLRSFVNFPHLTATAMSDNGYEFRPLVKLGQVYGSTRLRAIVASIRARSVTSQPDVTFSTVHRAKGLQWPVVRLSSDFLPWLQCETGSDKVSVNFAEGCVAYVAVTRAMHTLIMGSSFTETYRTCESLSKHLTGA